MSFTPVTLPESFVLQEAVVPHLWVSAVSFKLVVTRHRGSSTKLFLPLAACRPDFSHLGVGSCVPCVPSSAAAGPGRRRLAACPVLPGTDPHRWPCAREKGSASFTGCAPSSAALGRLDLALGSGDGLRGFNNSLQSRSAKGPHVFRRFHADATPSALWLKVYPPACHPCKVLTSFTTFKPLHFLFTGMCVPCVPCSAAGGPGGRRLAARLVPGTTAHRQALRLGEKEGALSSGSSFLPHAAGPFSTGPWESRRAAWF